MHTFSFSASTANSWLTEMAKIFQTQVKNNEITIPTNLGKGYIRLHEFSPDISLCIQQIYLHKPLSIARKANPQKNIVPMVFHYSNVGIKHIHVAAQEKKTLGRYNPQGIILPALALDSQIEFPAKEDIITMAVVVNRQWVNQYMQQIPGKEAEYLANLFVCQKSFFIYEALTHTMERVIKQILECNLSLPATQLFLQAKTTELLALFFDKLVQRELIQNFDNVNQSDVEVLFIVKKILLDNLENPPTISSLSREVGMSESKLKKIFKQVFGHSIYQYVLYNRMEKARKLLDSKQYNVSEVGGLVGYSNLAHFAKAFKKQYAIAPRQYLQKLRG